MKVFVATSGEYSAYRIQAVFACEEDARSFGLADDYLELEVNEGPLEVRLWWSLIWHPQGQHGTDPRPSSDNRLFDGRPDSLRHEWGKTHLYVPFLRVEGWDRVGVLKVYSEQRAQYLAKQDRGVEP